MQVSYSMTADHGYGWDVSYGVTADSDSVDVALKIKFTGTGQDVAQATSIWETGVESKWNVYAFFDMGSGATYNVNVDMQTASSGEDQDVAVYPGSGRSDMANFYMGDYPQYNTLIAAHEFGHMLGNYDEYEGGATHNGYVRDDSLMGVGLYDECKMLTTYMAGVESNAELLTGKSYATIMRSVSSSVTFSQNYYLTEKVQRLNAIAHEGKTDWTVSEVQAMFQNDNLSVYQDYDKNGAYLDDIDPNASFSETKYYANKAAQMNSLAYQGRNNWSATEVENLLAGSGYTPLEHYVLYGYNEGVSLA